MADTDPRTPHLPQQQADTLRSAFRAYSAAADPSDRWANRRLASVIRAATASGWSRRTVAAGLGISRERALKLSSYEPSLPCTVDGYRRGEGFPPSAVEAFRRIEQENADRRRSLEARLAVLIRSAHAAGWPYHLLGATVGATGEWMRQIAAMHPDAGFGTGRTGFDRYVRPLRGVPEPRPRGQLEESEKQAMRALAVKARGARKAPAAGGSAAERQAARAASEELSALIIAARERRVPWADLDGACGYRTGGARARAVRHGYGKLPPSMKGYSGARTPDKNTPAKNQYNV